MRNIRPSFCPFFFLSVLWFIFVLSGCSTTKPTPPPPSHGPVEAFIISAEPEQSTTLDDAAFGNGVRVSMDGTFISAKGEECRRATIIARGKEAEVIVICRSDGGYWFMAPRVWGNNRI